jgi:cytochrome P450/NADPH-cytochrome P450 reductase
MILQRFDLVDHEGYQLAIKETLTIKPDNFKMQVKKRAHLAGRASSPALT